MPKQRAKGTRYLTLTHLANACTDDKAMKVYRQGAVKLVNSLSRSSDVVRLETIDPEGRPSCASTSMISAGSRRTGTRCSRTIPTATQPDIAACERPAERDRHQAALCPRRLVRLRRPSQPGLYDKLLKLPETFQALAKEQGVDVDDNIKKFIAQRSGFQKFRREPEQPPDRAASARSPATSGPPTTSPATRASRACSSSRSARAATTASSTTAARPSSACPTASRPTT